MKEREKETVGGCSRRSFLKGAALTSAAAAGVMVFPGCSPRTTDDGGSSSKDERAFQESGSQASDRNPQDDSYTEFTTDYAAVFQPLTINKLTLPNRIVKSSAGSDSIKFAQGEIPRGALTYYEDLAVGGTGFIWVEQGNIWGAAGIGLSLAQPEDVAVWKPLTDMIHSHDALCGMQLLGDVFHFSSSKAHPADLDFNTTSNTPMTTEEVQEFIERIVSAAENCKAMGFDAVELNASGSHTFDSFLSRFWNTERDDQYGPQTLENRARIVTECIEGIRERCGEDYPIQVLFNPIEENVVQLGDSALCIKKEEGIEFAKLFEKAGANSFHIRSGIFGNHCSAFMTDYFNLPVAGHTAYGTIADFDQHMDGVWEGQRDGVLALMGIAGEIKKNVSIPVGVVGCADPRLAPDLVNDSIASGLIDFVIMNRPLIADPGMPNKLKEGRRDEVAPCAHCLTCFSGSLEDAPMYCRVNASMTHAYEEEMPEGTALIEAPTPMKVMVVGGGPAGMEAARIAALRGHVVTLYEKKNTTGGLLSFAASVKGTHEKIEDHKAYLQRQLEVAGVEVVTGEEVDADFVDSVAPDAVVVATGGIRSMVDVPGNDLAHVCSIEDYASQELGERVTVVGAGIQAIDFVIYLVKQGKKVTVVHEGPEEDIDKNCPAWVKYSNLSWIRSMGVQIYSGATLEEIDEDAVTISTDYGTVITIPSNNVVSCVDMLPDNTLATKLEDKYEVHVVGDASMPATIVDAISSGNIAARHISPADVAYDPNAKGSAEIDFANFDPSALGL